MESAALDRRAVLKALVLLPWLAGGCGSEDRWIRRERVCAHVYRPARFVPRVLENAPRVAVGSRGPGLLTVGLPELAVCTMPGSLLAIFPYFWPLRPAEIEALWARMRVIWAASRIRSGRDVEEYRRALDRIRAEPRPAGTHAVVLFTMNEATAAWVAAVTSASREHGADELVVFKDPAVPPYLCEHPALQKGFRRPPP